MANYPIGHSEFSHSEFRRGTVYPIRDPIKVVAFVEAFICAFILVVLIWANRSNSPGYWRIGDTAIWALACLAPIAVLLWSAVPKIARPRYVWLRRTIQLHAIAAACVTVVGCSGRWHPAVVYGLIAFGALLIDFIVLGLAPWSKADPDDIEIYRAAQLKVAGGAVAGIFIWSFLNIALVLGQSEIIAWGRPYCLQVAASQFSCYVAGNCVSRYKPVSSLMDLNGLKMHTPFTSGGGSSEFQDAYHAVLIVNQGDVVEWRHWSYAGQHFIRHDNARGFGRPACQPVSYFASRLSIW
jgi:hypothetical protein